MNTRHEPEHLSAERLQAFLDEELPMREHRLVEEHVQACARCSAKLAAWRVLFSELNEVEPLRPHEGFANRVMARVRVPEPLSLGDRVRARASALLGGTVREHVKPESLQDLVDGVLPRRHEARVRRHLEACASCTHQVDRWTGVFGTLDTLPRHAPSAAFADLVMAQVTVPTAVAARPARAAGRRIIAARLLRRARGLVPRTRRAWAALSGAAVTPVVTLGLVVYAVFSHAALTPGALLSYAWWQLSDLAAVAWGTGWAVLARGLTTVGARGLIDAAISAPAALAAVLIVYSVLVVLALRVLYKHLVTARSVGIRNAQTSHS